MSPATRHPDATPPTSPAARPANGRPAPDHARYRGEGLS